ncbi:MAG: hypothetical protein EWV91_05360 [Microcystis aeruginosa Ma_QC_Ca_00000000_S207]|uniref:Uncharacterized protein n=1 Tax=Microcystis aeruginosa Ma_QC_Ca_00000000_S207 TaxID=2486251 RepID=A0A552FXE0_MICAE|nr:MAG: hypothetical protein EWV91_05360 [Microcystis aeruginosa Ma_QC_Ca_00000000_S207]
MKRQPHSATILKKWRGEESPSVLRRRGCQISSLAEAPQINLSEILANIITKINKFLKGF